MVAGAAHITTSMVRQLGDKRGRAHHTNFCQASQTTFTLKMEQEQRNNLFHRLVKRMTSRRCHDRLGRVVHGDRWDWEPQPFVAGTITAQTCGASLPWGEGAPHVLYKLGSTARAKKKYKQTIVDIQELPSVKPNEIVIPLNSLNDLVRIADDLVKPALHKVAEGRHIYCIVDGTVRYQYVSQPRDSAFEGAP